MFRGIAELQAKIDGLVNLLSPAQAAKLGNAEEHEVSSSPEGNSMDISFDQPGYTSASLPTRSTTQSNAIPCMFPIQSVHLCRDSCV